AMGPASSPFPPYGLHGPAVRLGMRLVKGLRRSDADAISAAVRTHGPFDTVESLFRHSRVPVAALRCLAHADAFGSMGLSRQAALWHVRALRDESLPLFDDLDRLDRAHGHAAVLDRDDVALPPVSPVHQVSRDYATVGLSLKAHP